MTTIQYILLIFAVVSMVVGIIMIVRSIRKRKNSQHAQPVNYDKNGIPIIPRHERNIVEPPDLDDPIAGETTIVPKRSYVEPIIVEAGSAEAGSAHDSHAQARYAKTLYGDDDANSDSVVISTAPKQKAYAGDHHDSQHQPMGRTQRQVSIDDDEDSFSSLASATENLMPVIETAQEPAFEDNSPLLDQHLLATADANQNSPLNHAELNVNITLIPHNPTDTIEGTTVLSIVEQYGLRYGAMNMFHRYENKDGTGILWFSMMGITEEGITPFDLNDLPTAQLNGFIMFLSLPHPKALQGFDSMMSIVGLIANQLDMRVLDENNDILTRERKQQLRTQVQEYQLSHR